MARRAFFVAPFSGSAAAIFAGFQGPAGFPVLADFPLLAWEFRGGIPPAGFFPAPASGRANSKPASQYGLSS